MWILPKNLNESFPSVQEFVGLNEELNESIQISEQSLMWRSKPLLSKIWYRKWKKVYWLPLLYGRILKHSEQNRFDVALMESLEVIHASHLATLEIEAGQMIQGISGLISKTQSESSSQIGSSSKTSEVISLSDSLKLSSRWKEWVTKSTSEYSVRRKQAQVIREKEFLLWQSKSELAKPTPTTMESEHDQEKLKARAARLKARNNGLNGTKYSGNGCGPNLATKVQEVSAWPTPAARDYRSQHAENSDTFLQRMSHSRGVNLVEFMQREFWKTPIANQVGSTRADFTPKLHQQVLQWGTPTTRDFKDGSAESVKNVQVNGLLGRMDYSPQYQYFWRLSVC